VLGEAKSPELVEVKVAVATATTNTFLGKGLERPTLAGHSVPSLT
jgi:hypothetical protein